MSTSPFSIIAKQRQYFASGATQSIAARKAALIALRQSLRAHEVEIYAALREDLNKPPFDTLAAELGSLYQEINFALYHLRKWMKPQRASVSLLHFPSSGKIYPQPKGVVLIIGAWNYPLQLTLCPLVGALAAGNCAIIKPSELAVATERVLTKIIKAAFKEELCTVQSGDAQLTTALLEQRFDHIFFTGSPHVGSIVAQAAAKLLTPVTLELGGKSPCIVDRSANLKVAARRIIWGKFYNAGQTCIAPDYLLVHQDVYQKFMAHCRDALVQFYGTTPQLSPDYGRIINARHFQRLVTILDGVERDRILHGGSHDAQDRYIEPTLVAVDQEMKGFEQEIFGPLLPVLNFKHFNDIKAVIEKYPNPLACYIFADDSAFVDICLKRISFGGGAINNTLLHAATQSLPFGGIGESGTGAYHGEASFRTFTHYKSVLRTGTWLDSNVKYPPYAPAIFKLLKKLMK